VKVKIETHIYDMDGKAGKMREKAHGVVGSKKSRQSKLKKKLF